MQFVIFAIKQEICNLYYYKVEIMKRFLFEFLQNPDSLTYKKQVAFITDRFPFNEWLTRHLPSKETGKKAISISFPFFETSDRYGIINNKQSCCLFQCDSLWQAELVLFQSLRSLHQSFYIIETSGTHFGWISPLAGRRLLL